MVYRAGTVAVLVYVAATNLCVGFYLQSHGLLAGSTALGINVIDAVKQVSLSQLWGLARGVLNNEAAVFLALNWFFSVCTAAGLLTTMLYLGKLSQRESSRMAERAVKYIVQKFVFVGALSIGKDPAEVMLWLVWFYMVGFWRVFAGAAKDRMEALAVSPRAQPQLHIRAVSLLLLIMAQDSISMYTLFFFTWHGTSHGNFIPISIALLCAFDTVIILLESTKGVLVYATHVLDRRVLLLFLRRASGFSAAVEPGSSSSGSSWESWEGKGSFLYHLELVMDTAVHVLTLGHYLHIWLMHGLRLKLVDVILCLDVRAVVLSLQRRCKAYASYRAATHCLQHAFPDTHMQQLVEGSDAEGATTHDCTICMESMTVAKQLPCGHCFHLSCLRAWLQQSGSDNFSCPLCRQPLLEQERRPSRWQQDEMRTLELLRQPGFMGSLRRARQRLRMWVLALAVGVVAAAMQGSEVVVHRGRGPPLRGGTGPRSSRQRSGRRSMRRRQFQVLQELHAPGEEVVAESDGPPSGALMDELRQGMQESDAEGWAEEDEIEENRAAAEARDARSGGRDQVFANANMPGPSNAEARRVDSLETWLGGAAMAAARSMHSSFGIGGVSFGAVAGHEHEGEEEVMSARQQRGGAAADESRRAAQLRQQQQGIPVVLSAPAAQGGMPLHGEQSMRPRRGRAADPEPAAAPAAGRPSSRASQQNNGKEAAPEPAASGLNVEVQQPPEPQASSGRRTRARKGGPGL